MNALKWIGNLAIGTRLAALGVAAALGIIAVAVVGALGERASLMREKQVTTRYLVETALGIAAQQHARVQAGEIDEPQARENALAILRTLRYGKDDYFWVNDLHPRMVMHPFRPDLDGKDLSALADPNGVRLFVEMVQVVRARGSGFVPYEWARPGDSDPVPKVSYVALFEPWGWVIGTGIYVDDVAAEFRSTLLRAGAMLLVALVLIGLAIWQIGRSITRPIERAVAVAEAVAAGSLDNRIEATTTEETGRLLIALGHMQARIKEFMSAQLQMAGEHEAGRTAHRIDESAFPGQYAELARATNTLVSEQIAVTDEAIALLAEYAIGDLRRDMRELPGKKADITRTLHTSKRNLTAINAEILRLSAAAGRGDFSARGDEGRFQHAFGDMVRGLNALMEQADAGLSDVGRILDALARGDLSQSVQRRYEGAFGKLAQDANETVAQLAAIVRSIQQATETINSAASEIAAGNADLSARTEQQAASLEETAASMEELTSTVRGNAESARSANQLAIGAGDVAERGGSVVRQVVDTMGQIHAQSRKIEDIIGVIDGIAFQTNILALNAAVEAARAGEQGRGFAVVAGEVRTLAQRSAAAAREIKQLISDTVQRVDSGSQLVDSAGATMAEIVASVKRVTDIMGEISAASAEQTSGIEQVSATVTHMDEATQQNAALVEEATAAARSLEDQAGRLAQNVARFRL